MYWCKLCVYLCVFVQGLRACWGVSAQITGVQTELSRPEEERRGELVREWERDMGQCVTKCKNPTSSLGSKSGDKESGKSHGKKGGGGSGGGGGGHKEDSCPKSSTEPVYNGTKAPDVTVETSLAPPPQHGEGPKEECWAGEGDGVSLRRIEEMFLCYKDEQEDAILEEGMERFCEDLHVDPAEFRVLVLAWKFQAATMCKFTRWAGSPLKRRCGKADSVIWDGMCGAQIRWQCWQRDGRGVHMATQARAQQPNPAVKEHSSVHKSSLCLDSPQTSNNEWVPSVIIFPPFPKVMWV